MYISSTTDPIGHKSGNYLAIQQIRILHQSGMGRICTLATRTPENNTQLYISGTTGLIVLKFGKLRNTQTMCLES